MENIKRINKIKVSLILPSFKRAELLDLGLYSISQYNYANLFELEIIVVNDGIEDETEKVCDKYRKFFDIKYYFSGQRNKNESLKFRVPGFAMNIGVKKCSGKIIILSCPEIYHLNNCLEKIVPFTLNGRFLATPESMYFDNEGLVTSYLKNDLEEKNISFLNLFSSISNGTLGYEAVRMPYLMGMQKDEFMAIRGYDEDFIGYAGDDNDLVDRLLNFGCDYCRVDVKIIHLYHGKISSPYAQPDNPAWVYNNKLYQDRKGKSVRNIDREWGIL